MICWLDVCHIYVSAEISLCEKKKVQKQLNNVKGKSGGLPRKQAIARRAKSTIPITNIPVLYTVCISAFCLAFSITSTRQNIIIFSATSKSWEFCKNMTQHVFYFCIFPLFFLVSFTSLLYSMLIKILHTFNSIRWFIV